MRWVALLEKIGTGQQTIFARLWLLLSVGFLTYSPAYGLVISEIMYNPPGDDTDYEWLELYNETAAYQDLSCCQFTDGIEFTFPSGASLAPYGHLVVARNPNAVMTRYGISNVVGPYKGALDNGGEQVILRDPSGGIIAEVDYKDDGRWPVAPDGAGHSLSKLNLRGAPNDADNWRASPSLGGTPGVANQFEPWIEENKIIGSGEVWRYFKGYSEASNPIDAWRQVDFDDSGWLSGPTGIGYGDGDDATALDDMWWRYLSIFCRRTFYLGDPSWIDRLILTIDYDDGFVAYLNGVEVGRASMPPGTVYYDTAAYLHEASGGNEDPQPPTVLDITAFKYLLQPGRNVLAVQVHNNVIHSSDLTFIPTLISRSARQPDAPFPAVINEAHFRTSQLSFIEIYNRSDAAVDISRCYLSNNPDSLLLFQIPAGTMIPARGHAVFYGHQLGFALSLEGDRVFLTAPAGDAVLDAHAVEPGPIEWSEGRWPEGSDNWHNTIPSAGSANRTALTTSVVINEIMYHPPSNNSADEYVELYNAGTQAENLAGWRFSSGISYVFPRDMIISPGQYLVVAKDRDRLISRYGLAPKIVLGNYDGELNNGGEKICLRDAYNNIADEVKYADSGHWSKYADGYGSSLELIDPRHDNSNPLAWAPSDETTKSSWAYFSYSAVTLTDWNPQHHELHLHLAGPGEALIDDIHLTDGAVEYLTDGSFESGLGRWLPLGNHVRSYIMEGWAKGSSRSLRIVATGDGDSWANHIEQDAQSAMPSNRTYTVSFWARWMCGNRVLVTRMWGNQLAATHFLPLPETTGTPGAQNSVYQSNLGPLVSDVVHSPVVPGPTTPVRVRAFVYDPDGVADVALFYKPDTIASYTWAGMYDDGLHDDGAASDGVYGAYIPAMAANQTVAFTIRAIDSLGVANTWPRDLSQPALYRVENAPLTSGFPVYRIVMTADDAHLLANRPHPSNELLNCTFIFGEQGVYYNCGIRYTGSPFNRSDGLSPGYSGYKIVFNKDQPLHGQRPIIRVDFGPTTWPYVNRLSYQLLRWMGLPNSQLEWVLVRFNSETQGVKEDTLPPGNEYLSKFYRGNDDGFMFEVDERFEYINPLSDPDDTHLRSFIGQTASFDWWGPDKNAYRYNYRVANHDNEDDYTSIVLLMDVFGNTPDDLYADTFARTVNVEEWFKVFAVRACISDWDFFAFVRGKGAYLYWPPANGRWDLLSWDQEWTFQDAWTTMSIWSIHPSVRRFQSFGRHQHFYFTYLKEMLDKHFTHASLDAWVNHYSSLLGGDYATTMATSTKSFIDKRRAYLLDLIPTASVGITTNKGNPVTVAARSVTLEGTAPVSVRWAQVNGVLHYLDWTGPTTWRLTLPLAQDETALSFTFLDYEKRAVGTGSIVVFSSPPTGVERWTHYR